MPSPPTRWRDKPAVQSTACRVQRSARRQSDARRRCAKWPKGVQRGRRTRSSMATPQLGPRMTVATWIRRAGVVLIAAYLVSNTLAVVTRMILLGRSEAVLQAYL